MPVRPKISTLPPTILATLHRKLLVSGFGEYHALSAWLEEKGYRIGKSAIGMYAKANRSRIEAEARLKPRRPGGIDPIELRLRCLEIASRSVAGHDMLNKADELVEWVRREA